MLTIIINDECLTIIGNPYLNEARAILNMAYTLGYKHMIENVEGCTMVKEKPDGK